MSYRGRATALIDAGFWIALLDENDQHHQRACEKQDLLDDCTILLPWPILYETLRTRFVKAPAKIEGFRRILQRPAVERLDDAAYRVKALETALSGRRRLSLVDCVLRMVLEDTNVKVDYLYTFNPGDFHDVCRRRSVVMMCQ